MGRRNRNLKRHTKKRKHKQDPADKLLKATIGTTKLAVTGLVGAGLISTTSAAMRNLTGK